MPVPESLHAAFEGLRAGARWRVDDPRAAATIVLGCILVTTATIIAFWPDSAPEQRRAVATSAVSAPPKSETPNPTPPARAAQQTSAPATDVKVIGAAPATEKPCEEQTWPYIDRRCLTVAEDQPKKRAVPQTASRQPDPPDQQPVGSVTAIAPTPPVSTMVQGNVGTPSTPAAGGTETAAAHPLPPQQQPAPAASEKAQTPASTAIVEPAPALSRREQSRLTREQRQRPSLRPAPAAAEAATDGSASREADAAIGTAATASSPQPQLAAATDQPDVQPKSSGAAPAASRHEQRRQVREQQRFDAPKKERARSDPNRIVRRWKEYTYAEPQGQSRRVIVIQRGSARDDFFQNMR